MKRSVSAAGTAAAVVLVAGLLSCVPAGAHAVTAGTRARPVLEIASTLAGPLLVDHRGYTVFMFTRDKRGRDVCRTIKGCETDWPAVTVTGKLVLGPGVNRKLVGTIPYKGKERELTYGGRPLHTYKFDYAPASVMNVGNTQFGGDWWALSSTGTIVQ